VINGHSFILIRQMASLVRRASVELCTVPLLLVVIIIVFVLDETLFAMRQRKTVVTCAIYSMQLLHAIYCMQ